MEYQEIGGFVRFVGVYDQGVWLDVSTIEMVAETDVGSQVRMASGNTYHLTCCAEDVLNFINECRVP